MISSLFGVLKAALGIWENKEKRKYMDRLIKLEKQYYEEDNKERPDMAVLDNLEFELRLFSSAVSAEIGKSNLTASS